MNIKNVFALGFGLLIAACAATTEPTDGTDTTGAKTDTTEKTEATQSTSEALKLPIGLPGPVCGTKQCAAGQRCCGCNSCAPAHAICPDIVCPSSL